MCGIVGVLSFNNSFQITNNYISLIRDKMYHRGPDGSGLWISEDKKVGLGHRRLSIIDLSELANQPMSNEDNSIFVVFNGEIYNHAEIRQYLEKNGSHRWKTDHSDTEVIIHSYEEWGIACIEKFRGMFAIAIWDGKKEELWLIRDRIGKKPIYYSMNGNRFIFASEIKAILADRDQVRKVNEEALFHYLSFLTTPSPMTMFDGIYKIPPGTWLKIDKRGDIKINKYWDVLDNKRYVDIDEKELSNVIIDELRESVNLRKVSDVPVGVFLSGGIDSSTNAILFSESEKRPIKTFTIGYKGDYKSYKNELDFAKIIANKIKSEHHELLLSIDDLINFLPKMIELQDEPIADPVCVPLYYVSKLARDNDVIVCQVGEGSDELFCGYPYWIRRLKYKKFLSKIPGFIKKSAYCGVNLLNREDSVVGEILKRDINNYPIFWGGAEAFTEGKKFKLLSYNMKNKFKGFSSWEAIKPIYNKYNDKSINCSVLGWMTYLDLNLRLPELLLMRVDKMSMGVSVECRTPFLDHKFVELIFGIPDDKKIKNYEPKYILKKAVEGLVPDEILNRPKQGFGVPIYEWFFDKLGAWAKREIDEFVEQTDFFDKSNIDKLFYERANNEIWYILNLALWWKHYIYC